MRKAKTKLTQKQKLTQTQTQNKHKTQRQNNNKNKNQNNNNNKINKEIRTTKKTTTMLHAMLYALTCSNPFPGSDQFEVV